jgi:hypothetical protein
MDTIETLASQITSLKESFVLQLNNVKTTLAGHINDLDKSEEEKDTAMWDEVKRLAGLVGTLQSSVNQMIKVVQQTSRITKDSAFDALQAAETNKQTAKEAKETLESAKKVVESAQTTVEEVKTVIGGGENK